VLCLCYFGIIMGLYGIGFWLPTLIKAAGVNDALNVGLLTTIPYGAGGLVASTLVGRNVALAVVSLTVATVGILGALCQFWAIPPAFLGGVAAAAGIALINSVGNLAGFVSPYLVGWIKDMTHSTDIGLYCVAASLIVAAAIVLTMPRSVVNR
jgi:hypothetical protein